MIKKLLNKYKQRAQLKALRQKGLELLPPQMISDYSAIHFTPPVYIGPDSWLSLRGNLYIGSGTIIGPRVKVHTSNHRYEGSLLPYDDMYLVRDVTIQSNVWIGADVTILPGITIGEGAIIGACACITKDIPPLAIVGGNPAKIIKYRDKNRYIELKTQNKIYLTYKKEGKTNLDEQKRILRFY